MTTCEHAEPKVARMCRGLLAGDQPYRMRFTGRGIDSELICEACEAAHLLDVCAGCRAKAEDWDWTGFAGEPEIATAASRLGFVRELARVIAAEQTFHELPVLADALEVAGCSDSELLAHCRAPGEHGARCSAIDRLLGA